MTTAERALAYIRSVPPATEGHRNAELNRVAFALRAAVDGLAWADYEAALVEWARSCSPPLQGREVDSTIRSAWGGADTKGAVASPKTVRVKFGKSRPAPAAAKPPPPPAPAASTSDKPGPRWEMPDTLEMPDPMPQGARRLLEAAFLPGEWIRCALARDSDDPGRAGKEIPRDGGITLTREEWLRKLDESFDDPPFASSDRNGIFISVNPMVCGGTGDKDVTAFRHALVEFDSISLDEQWHVLTASRVPATAILYSGGKSLHAWVRVDAPDRAEYDARVKLLYEHLREYKPDNANKNPSRFSRLPGCPRKDKRQELLAVNTGAPSWDQWAAELRLADLVELYTPDDLWSFDVSADPDNLIGDRWLCRGGSALLIGPSGVGKSSLNMQMAVLWALGRDVFGGLRPIRPLKSLIIQAENDKGDLAEMFQGVCAGLDIHRHTEEGRMLTSNIAIQRNTIHTGRAFCDVLRNLIDLHRPDLVWFDPLLSFVGDDISQQAVVGQFFRNWLAPILTQSRVAVVLVHHTGKPPGDKDARKGWRTSDHAYAGLGSSDLTNWARAVTTLREVEEHVFTLTMAKRGRRSGLSDGVWVKWSEDPKRIYWEEAAPPEPQSKPPPAAPQPGRAQKIASMNSASLLATITEPVSPAEFKRRLTAWLSNEAPERMLVDARSGTVRRAIEMLLASGKLQADKDGQLSKGPNS